MPSTMTNNTVVATDIYKCFADLEVLKGVSLSIAHSDVVALIGPSGSGKSTLLRCLNRLEKIDRGEIQIDGQTLVETVETSGVVQAKYAPEKEARKICDKIGMVFQHFNLFPHMTVLDNLLVAPMTVKKMSKEEIYPKAQELLNKVGLQSKGNNYPSQLSGGQKQRVAIARALAMDPEIMLFDEPTSALDPELTHEVLHTIKQLAQENMTMLIVTHEMAFAREVADHVYFMDQGQIIEGAPAKAFFENPQQKRTQAFLQNMLS